MMGLCRNRFVAAAMAQSLAINTFPSTGVVAGQTYEVTYSPADNIPTTFVLRQGASGNLNTIDTLTTTATGGKFSWTVAKTLANQPNYALEIRRGDKVNYSAQFGLTGGAAAAISSAVYSASASAASAVSSASAAISSAISSARASASMSPSAGVNTTVSTATLSRSASGTSRPTSSATSSGKLPESTGAASSMTGSPLVAILGAIAAFAYLA